MRHACAHIFLQNFIHVPFNVMQFLFGRFLVQYEFSPFKLHSASLSSLNIERHIRLRSTKGASAICRCAYSLTRFLVLLRSAALRNCNGWWAFLSPFFYHQRIVCSSLFERCLLMLDVAVVDLGLP